MAQADRVDQIAEEFWASVRSGAHKQRGLSDRGLLLETVAGYMAEQVENHQHQEEQKEESSMSKAWNQQELEAASAAMVAQGNMGYEEFCEKVMPMLEGGRLRAAFNLKGAERKPLVQAVSAITGEPSKYRGMPSCVYEVGSYRIGKDGELSAVPGTDSGAFERMLEQLALKGFEAALETKPTLSPEPPVEPEASTPPAQLPELALPALESSVTAFTVEIPLEGFTMGKLDNLRKLINSKSALIKKSLGVPNLPVGQREDRLTFPWFDRELDSLEIKTYTHFIAALCDTAKRQQRVVATEKDVPSERFTFRIFLLKLGFAGPEYAEERKLLYRNLSGDCAFNSTDKRDAHADKWKGINRERRAAGKLSNQAVVPDELEVDQPADAASDAAV